MKFTIKSLSLAITLSSLVVNAAPLDSTEYRAGQIRSAFQHAWKGYSTFAYGHDELLPVSTSFYDSRYMHIQNFI
jgi:mannosyl-oligosaccharide alpha-1,2-mannosidase